MLDHQDIGVLILLVRARLRISEILVNMFPRKSGQSRIFQLMSRIFIHDPHVELALAKRQLGVINRQNSGIQWHRMR